MKITLTFKTPDVAEDAIEDLDQKQRVKAKAAIAKYVEYDEYVRIEIDIYTGNAKVLRV